MLLIDEPVAAVAAVEPDWLVFYVGSGREVEILSWLAAEGSVAYAPFEHYSHRPKRLKHWIDVKRPAFPNYVFVRNGSKITHQRLKQAPGFLHILVVQGSYVRIRQKIIDVLLKMEEEGMFDRRGMTLGDDHWRPMVGENYLVGFGPLTGRTGKCVESKGQLAELDFGFLFGRVKISVSNLAKMVQKSDDDSRG